MFTASPAYAAPPVIEDLGVPLQDVLLLGGVVAPGPGGKTVIWSASSGVPAHLNAVDPATGAEVARFDLPDAGGAWAVDATPDGSVYAGTYGDSHLFRWDGEGTASRTSATPCGVRPSSGRWPRARAPPSTAARRRAAGCSATTRRPVYATTAGSPPRTPTSAASPTPTARSTRERRPPPRSSRSDAAGGAVRQLPLPPGLDPAGKWAYDVNVAAGHLYVRFGGAFPGPLHVWDLASGTWIDTVDPAHGLDVSPPDEEGRVYFVKAGELVRYDPRTKTTTPTGVPVTGRVANTRGIGWAELGLPDYPGKSLVGLLWRGMMFRYNPQTGAKSFVQSGIRGEPIDVTALSQGPDGRMYAGGFLNGGFAAMNAETGKAEEFHTFSQSEDMVSHDGRLYVGAYPDARVYSYDPKLPWNSTEYSPSPEPGPRAQPGQAVRPRGRQADQTEGHGVRGPVPGRRHHAGPRPPRRRAGHLGPGRGQAQALPAQRGHRPVDRLARLPRRRRLRRHLHLQWPVGHPAHPEGGQALRLVGGGEQDAVGDHPRSWQACRPGSGLRLPGQAVGRRGRRGLRRQHPPAQGGQAGHAVRQQELQRQLAFNPRDRRLYGAHAGRSVFSLDPFTGRHAVLKDGPVHQLAVHGSGDVYFAEGPKLFRYHQGR
ncbi:hypothetical protein [Nonomuraea dietziae]|uniref:hypothetical protein n=1 Tax=Nonomuraea dietziae TaxID=65515 RepID=UPI0031D81638